MNTLHGGYQHPFLHNFTNFFSSFRGALVPPDTNWTLLMHPTSRGGLTLPDFHKYFLASQLVMAQWWLYVDMSNAFMFLEAAVVHSLRPSRILYSSESCSPLFLDSFHAHQSQVLESLTCKGFLWTSISPNTPLWLNLTLLPFYMWPDPQAWARYKIKVISHSVDNCSPKYCCCRHQKAYPKKKHGSWRSVCRHEEVAGDQQSVRGDENILVYEAKWQLFM